MMYILKIDGKVKLIENFFAKNEADEYFNQIREQLNWREEKIRLFSKRIICPRLIDFYGDEGVFYNYSGNHHIAHGWSNLLIPIKDKLECHIGLQFNFVLCNYYRNGHDYIGWHDDNEMDLGKNPVIASISFGAERKFQFRHKKTKKLKVSCSLKPGSLVIMYGQTQEYWKHRLPKCIKCHEARINLTFRKIVRKV